MEAKQIGIIFDRDNTLIRSGKMKMLKLTCKLWLIARLNPLSLITYWEKISDNPAYPWPKTPQEEPVFWEYFWNDIGKQYNLTQKQIYRLCSELGPFYHEQYIPYPDTLECLQKLKQLGLNMAVLTNFRLPSINLTLEYSGIDPKFFDVLVSSSEISVRKPHPKAFLETANRLKLMPEHCYVIDDTVEHIKSAAALGFKVVLIDRKKKYKSNEFPVVHSLDEFVKLIGSQIY